MASITTTAALAAAAIAASTAGATTYIFDFERGDPGSYGIRDNGGTIQSIYSTFDTVSQQLSFSVTFSDDITEGFTLALNDGPNPKGHGGELALLYVDLDHNGSTAVTAYSYNGKNLNNSWRDGDGSTSGNQTADFIDSSEAPSSTLMTSSNIARSAGALTASFTIDVSGINSHNPMYPGNSPWTGLAFGEKLGIWFHTWTNFDATYDQNGGMTSLTANGGHGWMDGTNFTTIPTPGSIAIIGAAGLVATRRRRA